MLASILWQVLTITLICMKYKKKMGASSLHLLCMNILVTFYSVRHIKHLVQSVIFLASGSRQTLSACFQTFQPFFCLIFPFFWLKFFWKLTEAVCAVFDRPGPLGEKIGAPLVFDRPGPSGKSQGTPEVL